MGGVRKFIIDIKRVGKKEIKAVSYEKLERLKKIRAIIFDMDDLMINSHPRHMEVFEKVLNKHGASLHDPQNPLAIKEEAKMFGRSIKNVFAEFHTKYNLPQTVTVDDLNKEFNENLLPVFDEMVDPMPYLQELIYFFKKNNYQLILASSAKSKKIEIVLKKLKLEAVFTTIVSGEDDVEQSKPAPDIFLKAAGKAGVDPKVCAVLEDAKNGIEAANAAGMISLGIHNRFTKEKLGIRQNLHEAFLQLESLENVEILFQKILNSK